MEYDGYKDMCERLKRTIDARNDELATLRAEVERFRKEMGYVSEYLKMEQYESALNTAKEALK